MDHNVSAKRRKRRTPAPGTRREHEEKEPGPDSEMSGIRYQTRQRRRRIADDAFRHVQSLELSKLQVILPVNPQSGGCFGRRFFHERSLVSTANSKCYM